jgi:signal recognition particle GTPase
MDKVVFIVSGYFTTSKVMYSRDKIKIRSVSSQERERGKDVKKEKTWRVCKGKGREIEKISKKKKKLKKKKPTTVERTCGMTLLYS